MPKNVLELTVDQGLILKRFVEKIEHQSKDPKMGLIADLMKATPEELNSNVFAQVKKVLLRAQNGEVKVSVDEVLENLTNPVFLMEHKLIDS